MKSWFEIQNRTGNSINISIIGDIGSNGVSASSFKSELDKHEGASSIHMDVYSNGGNMYDGLYMFDLLNSHPAHKTGRVINIAASAATYPLMSMDVVDMPSNSKIMIHQPKASIDFANSGYLRKVAGLMDDMQSVALDIYQHKTRMDRNAIEEMVNAETYITADQAKKLGFADIVSSPYSVKNQANDALMNISSIRDLENFLRESGYSKQRAIEIIAKIKRSYSVEDIDYTPISNALSGLKIPKSLF